MSQYTSVGLPCPVPSQLFSCSVIFAVHCNRVLVSTFPEINILFMGRGTRQAQQHQISVSNNRWQSCKMNKGGAPSGQRTATQKRLRDKEEEKNPDAKTQREEDVKEAKRNFFSRHTARQSLPNIDIQMSGEPSAEPVSTTRTTPAQDRLLAFDPPPKQLDQRVHGQVYTPADGPFRGVPVQWSSSGKTYVCTCDSSVHGGNSLASRCPVIAKRTSASTEVSQTVEQPTTRLVGGASSSKATINYDNMHLDPGHLQSLTSIHHIPACSETFGATFLMPASSFEKTKLEEMVGEERTQTIKPGDMVVFTAVLYNADANQDWLHSIVSLRACIVLLLERFPSIKTLRLRTDGAGNFRNSSFVLLMSKLSKWIGVNIVEFSVSEAGGGKDLTDSLIM